MKPRKFSAKLLASTLAVLLVQPFQLLAAAGGDPALPDPGSPSMSRQQQEQLGLQAAAEVYKQMPVLPDNNQVTQYVQQLGKKLERVIPPDKSWPYQFHVVPAADINAFALPGGPIFVNLGTVQAADNEAELVGVLAHEMSHVYMQHSAKQAPKAAAAQIIAGLAGAVLGGSAAGSLARVGIQFGAGTMLMKYSRKDEAQADAVGAIIMHKAGYNPKAMADFFTKLEQKYGNGGPQLLSSHPNPGNREQAIGKEIQNWPRKNYINDSPQFAGIRNAAKSMKTYSAQEIDAGAKQGVWARENQKNGALPRGAAAVPASDQQGNGEPQAGGDMSNVSFSQIQPSGNFRQFQQSGISIAYPENWQSGGDQNGATIAPAAGAGQAGIAYGVVISNAPIGGNNLDQAMQQILQGLEKDNPGIQAEGNPSNIDVNGVQGRSMFLRGNSPIQQNGKPLPERDWLVLLPNPRGGVTYLVFVAPEHDFNKLKPTYQKMLDSLRLG